jgi:hypothetical protein
MEWIEIIQLRSYTCSDRDEAVAAFHQLPLPDQARGIGEITLSRNIILDNDLCIFIDWHCEVPEKGKSQLGLQLAAAFSQFGKIYHSAWQHDTKFPMATRRTS